ncbi:MAG: lytic transglycosylase domain-containing protein, partial [Solirubrobacteraceae bacterium]
MAVPPKPHPDLQLWLAIEQFISTPLDHDSALLRLLGRLDPERQPPETPALVVRRGNLETRYGGRAGTVADPKRLLRRRSPQRPALWLAAFEVPLEVVTYPDALFTLSADGHAAIALPVPCLSKPPARAQGHRSSLVKHARRQGVALLAGFAAATAVSAGAIASASTTSSPVDPTVSTAVTTVAGATDTSTATETTSTTDTTTATTPTDTTATTTSTPLPSASDSTSSTGASTPTTAETTASSPAPAPPPAETTPAKTPGPTPGTTASPPAHHRHPTAGSHKSGVPAAPAPPAAHHHSAAKPRKPTHRSSHAGSPRTHRHASTTGRQSAGRRPASAPTADVSGPGAAPSSFSASAAGTPVFDPFTAAQIAHFESIGASADQPPKFLIPIYKAAGRRYHVPWQILAAINAIETDYGQNLNVSVAGAIGWMQFEPGTWLQYGVRAHGSGRPNPYDPEDAIFSAARYLAANGAPDDMHRAILAYNHAEWYVDAVLWRAQLIGSRDLGVAGDPSNYALPLDAQYMRTLGRTDDGVDIETAPDGAGVYSITPGTVTAVA